MEKKTLKLAKLVEPCQRNWQDDFIVPKEDQEYICNVATRMPTKQNKPSYDLYCITDKDIIQRVFEVAYNPNDIDFTYLKNPQAKANCLLIWTFNYCRESEADVNINIGISAGAAAIAAAELGYKTGFCKCFVVTELQQILDSNSPALILGFGKPDTRFTRIDRVENDKKIGEKASKGQKNVSVYYID
jgi:hypothetical protein|tara:strand:- start:205 stop:768 length:564 start_codon:yes stop_codon:yes gene_type:complete